MDARSGSFIMSGGHQVESGEEGLNINALLKLESRFFNHVNSLEFGRMVNNLNR